MAATLPENPTDDEIRALLERVRRIAVIGLSPKPHRDSHRVSSYMQRAGYEIVPVYPREEEILGARVYRSVNEIEEPVDLVNVFRRAEDLPGVASDTITSKAARAATVWCQYDCVHEGAIASLVSAGRLVIYDRCLMVEHTRLIGRR